MRGRLRQRRGDTGAATLEFTGMIAVAVLLAVSLLLVAITGGSGDLSAVFRSAICKVITLGQGDCPGGDGSDPDQSRVPPEPCVVSSNSAAMDREIAVVFFTASDGRTYEVAKLSDGRFRVTLGESDGRGLEAGIGVGATVTINDRTVGGSATAEASAGLELRGGKVWYADDEGELRQLLGESTEDTIEDEVLGDDNPVRGVWEWGQDRVGDITGNGDYEFPEPDEEYTEGGLVVDASAQATSLYDRAGAEVGISETAGVKTTKGGRTTVYIKSTVRGEAGLQTIGVDTDGPEWQGANLSGEMTVMTAVTFDSSGAMVEVSTTATQAGESKGAANALFGGSSDPSLNEQVSGATVYQATLPIRTDSDRLLAAGYLTATGAAQLGGPLVQAVALPAAAYATSEFVAAARDRGYLTRQDYATNDTTVFGYDVEAKYGVEFGASGEVRTSDRTTTNADYWDGNSWEDWPGCAA